MRHKVHPNQVNAWKQPAVEGMKEVFSKGGSGVVRTARGDPGLRRDDRGVDGGAGFLARGLKWSVGSHPNLSLSRQCHLLV